MDKKYLKEKIEESNAQLDFMSKTIDNFRDFYKPNKQKEIFYISVAVKKALEIMEPIFESNKIEFKFNVIKDKQINAYENEYSQVILNILTNAKDVLISRQIQNPKIIISINELLQIYNNLMPPEVLSVSIPEFPLPITDVFS